MKSTFRAVTAALVSSAAVTAATLLTLPPAQAATGTPVPPAPSAALAGTWVNTNHATRNIVDLVVSTAEGIALSCTSAQFEQLDAAEETQFLPGGDALWGYGQDQMLSQPYYGLGGPALGMSGIGMGAGMGGTSGPQVVTNDRVPTGEVEVRRGDHVHATDGAIGRVQGLVVHPGDHCVTHVLLDEGHLWGQKKVAIPISAVTDVEDGVRLNLSKDEVRDLPEVGLLGSSPSDGKE